MRIANNVLLRNQTDSLLLLQARTRKRLINKWAFLFNQSIYYRYEYWSTQSYIDNWVIVNSYKFNSEWNPTEKIQMIWVSKKIKHKLNWYELDFVVRSWNHWSASWPLIPYFAESETLFAHQYLSQWVSMRTELDSIR